MQPKISSRSRPRPANASANRHPMTPLLAVRDLHVNYRVGDGVARAVDGVSFAVPPGGALGLVGESGCGKSSLALAIPRLHSVSTRVSGSIQFDGKELLTASEEELRSIRGRGVA